MPRATPRATSPATRRGLRRDARRATDPARSPRRRPATPRRARRRRVADAAARSARVLVADDHFAMAQLLADQLGDAGYAVEVAAGGEAALACARARTPDV